MIDSKMNQIPGREWMYERKFSTGELNLDFIDGLDKFINFAVQHPSRMDGSKIRCPCARCDNKNFLYTDTVKEHLVRRGFTKNYYDWRFHYDVEASSSSRQIESMHCDPPLNPYQHMVHDAWGQSGAHEHWQYVLPTYMPEPPFNESQQFYNLLEASKSDLWDGCDYSELSTNARIMTMKSEHRMSQRAVDELCQFMEERLPKPNRMPNSFYKCKKQMQTLDMPHLKIHCCKKGCMIYWREDENRTECKVCGQARFKDNGRSPFKKMYYFPLGPRLRRLYASEVTAQSMRWHAEHAQTPGEMRHPADSIAWKTFDKSHPLFASESRNVRLALSTDGFQPFGQSGSQYSLWPVILTPYNLPPWMCMKDPYMFLTVIVPGPKSPKQKIDVFLQPLIAELNDLWAEGIPAYDISRKQNFQLRAALMWTISDFPAYSMLSGWSTSGHRACPYCMEDSQAFSLKHGRKTTWFDCHRRFLNRNHRFRRDKKNFIKNRTEHSGPPSILNGEQILDNLEQFEYKRVFDEGAETANSELSKIFGWNKRSIFWDLPYWKTNVIRHNLDVMHIEKNVFDNIFNTIMNVEGKTKDNANARRDLEELGIRPELWPCDGKYHKANFTLDKESMKLLLKWLNILKFPDGYVSNLSRCIDMKKHKLYGMKSHDCHVFMQRLLPIGLRELLPHDVWEPLTELSNFFRDLTATVIREADMTKYSESIVVTLCKLEMIFPPSFFDSMEHLPVHLAYEALIAGPVQFRWMYPFERYMRKLKLNVKNKAAVEASICNAYLTEESSHFCTHYFESHVRCRGRDVPRNDDGGGSTHSTDMLQIFTFDTRCVGKGRARFLSEVEYRAAHTYILLNTQEAKEYEQ